MKTLLLANDWWLYHSCTCGGTRKEKYKHKSKPGVEIHLRPTKALWFEMRGRTVYSKGQGIQTLELKLAEI